MYYSLGVYVTRDWTKHVIYVFGHMIVLHLFFHSLHSSVKSAAITQNAKLLYKLKEPWLVSEVIEFKNSFVINAEIGIFFFYVQVNKYTL